MKKRIIALMLAILMLSASLCAFAALGEGVETPMIPVDGSAGTKRAALKLWTNAPSQVSIGSDVEVFTNISKLGDDGLSKIILNYTFSGALKYNYDVKVIGLPEGWKLSNVVSQNGKLSFTVSDTAGSNPLLGVNELNIKFSVNVGTSSEEPLISFGVAELYDKNGERIINTPTKTYENNSFTTKASVPEIQNIGASLRINNTPALRFGMRIAKDDCFKRAFPSGNFSWSDSSDMKFGMLIIKKNELSGELTADTLDATEIIFETALSENSNEIVFAHLADNVTNYKEEYTFRPFVLFRENGGEYKYYYGTVETRSAKKVAQLQLESEENTRKIEMLNKFVG